MKATVSYHTETGPWPYQVEPIFLEALAEAYGYRIHRLSYMLVDDNKLLEINKKHLNHDYFTDIITFPFSRGRRIIAEVFISHDRIVENSRLHGVSKKEECARVVLHGLLHLCGLDDHTDAEKSEMRRMEEHYLRQLFHVEQ